MVTVTAIPERIPPHGSDLDCRACCIKSILLCPQACCSFAPISRPGVTMPIEPLKSGAPAGFTTPIRLSHLCQVFLQQNRIACPYQLVAFQTPCLATTMRCGHHTRTWGLKAEAMPQPHATHVAILHLQYFDLNGSMTCHLVVLEVINLSGSWPP